MAKINALNVVLEKDYSDEEVQKLINAILLLKGVVFVTANAADINEVIAKARAKNEIREKLLNIILEQD